ncbi:hypothetical protein BZA05DRAFT_475450 [Tricharina praecox]|uniref:uncharacterized protein n=1 Tax=Tricharina praecox TaxID=43433 RepID=UPI00221F0BD7|nr:uncharacterized protein BZA05DRAFT_475450 [Tricharina praecox]KAI5848395.1 hypothetical protein BZA05DRAFT_475450 [Tricharina praecox]
MAGFIYKENKVPQYQRLYQRDDGVRLWNKHPRSRVLLLPYFAILGVGVAGSIYGMVRMAAGKKTFY